MRPRTLYPACIFLLAVTSQLAPSQTASRVTPLDPTRNLTRPTLEGAIHQPLPEEYIWTAGRDRRRGQAPLRPPPIHRPHRASLLPPRLPARPVPAAGHALHRRPAQPRSLAQRPARRPGRERRHLAPRHARPQPRSQAILKPGAGTPSPSKPSAAAASPDSPTPRSSPADLRTSPRSQDRPRRARDRCG